MKDRIANFIKRATLGAVIFLTASFCVGYGVRAEAAIEMKETSVTLYVGNTYSPEYTVTELEELEVASDEWWDAYWTYAPYVSVSDSSVISYDSWDNIITAIKPGKTSLLIVSGLDMAELKITVKDNGAKISKKSVEIYKGDSFDLKISWKNKKIKEYDCRITDEYGNSCQYDFEIKNKGKGKFTFQDKSAGTYNIDLILTLKSGKTYSKRCSVNVLPCGLDEEYFAVGIDQTISLLLQNATITGITESEDIEWWMYNDGEVKITSKLNIKGTKLGEKHLTVSYTTMNGKEVSEDITVYITDPEYIPFEDVLRKGNSYYPNCNGASNYSKYELSSSDTSVVEIRNDGYRPYFWTKGFGTATLTVVIDGKEFTQTVSVIDPQLNVYDCVLKKGKTKTLKVTGVPEDTKITYKSSDKKIATVSKTGKITAKKKGSCYITVTVGNIETMYCTVNVSSGYAAGAVNKGYSVLGASYSQDRRMEEGYYDCSSFAWRSYNDAGLALGGLTYAPTAAGLAEMLEKDGKAIAYEYTNPSELMPGDLIFYCGSYDNGRYLMIDHVAMYFGAYYCEDWWEGTMVNTGMIIHASNGVQMKQYNMHRTDQIVMICRPTKK